jgi:hypothetical protein
MLLKTFHLILLLWLGTALLAQPTQDPAYVTDLSQRVTLRLYGSHKFNSMLMRAEGDGTDLRFRPNGQINIGLGASLRKLTLNIGVRMPFVNDDVDAKGRTRYLDAQANVYGTKQASTLFLQVYQGYHITSHTMAALGWRQSTEFPYRADLLQYNIGISSLRVVNHERFSYRAGFNQDAVQLRSQGSWLIGGYLTSYFLQADSALVPTRLETDFPHSAGIRKAGFYDLGPMGGYAYTQVFGSGLFATASAALGAGPSIQVRRFANTEGEGREVRFGPGWHAQFRVSAGYNSRSRYVGVVFTQEHIGYVQRAQQRFAWDVGLVRLVFAQRFKERPTAMDRSTRWLQRKKKEVLP